MTATVQFVWAIAASNLQARLNEHKFIAEHVAELDRKFQSASLSAVALNRAAFQSFE